MNNYIEDLTWMWLKSVLSTTWKFKKKFFIAIILIIREARFKVQLDYDKKVYLTEYKCWKKQTFISAILLTQKIMFKVQLHYKKRMYLI